MAGRLACLLLATTVLAAPPVLAAGVDVAIVFAVDASASIGPDHALDQREGHADALVDPQVLAAIHRGREGCIAVTYFEWGSRDRFNPILPWTRICDAHDARIAASRIRKLGDRGVRDGSERTSLSFAIDHATWLLDRLPSPAVVKIIDISCNGPNNDGVTVGASHASALAKGYVINALVVVDSWKERPVDLLGYLAEEIIGGSGAFVMVSGRPQDYKTALRRKLVMEVSWVATGAEEGHR